MTDPSGDTAHEMRLAGLTAIAPLDDKEKIKNALLAFLADIESNTAPVATDEAVTLASRRNRTVELARTLDAVVSRYE